ncbi:hypothetical protein GYA44_00085, partial [Candidatus Microgenomates bacterium]|nr:hypothetical protein [Candidatus Microgenomates bacterium]
VAEIIPNNDKVDPNEIIKEIINNGTNLVSMKLDYPSLNQIFIDLMKTE